MSTQESTQDKIKVMQAFVDGREVNVRERYPLFPGEDGKGKWFTVGKKPDWNWRDNEYRVKPREMWVVYYSWRSDTRRYVAFDSLEKARHWAEEYCEFHSDAHAEVCPFREVLEVLDE